MLERSVLESELEAARERLGETQRYIAWLEAGLNLDAIPLELVSGEHIPPESPETVQATPDSTTTVRRAVVEPRVARAPRSAAVSTDGSRRDPAANKARVLTFLVQAKGWIALKDVVEGTGFNHTTAHKYVNELIATGKVEHNGKRARGARIRAVEVRSDSEMRRKAESTTLSNREAEDNAVQVVALRQKVLDKLAMFGGATFNRLVFEVDAEPPAVNAALTRLLADGYVTLGDDEKYRRTAKEPGAPAIKPRPRQPEAIA